MADLAQGLRNFLFGSGPLKQAANQGAAPAPTPQPAQPAGIDMQAEAAKAAQRSLPKPVAPASTRTAPAAPKKKPTVAGTVGATLMEQ